MRLRLNDTVVDLDTGGVQQSSEAFRITSMELALLTYLFSARHRPVPRRELLCEVWGYGPQVRSRTDYATVHTLRRKLGDAGWIVTHRGHGFQLGESVVAVPGQRTLRKDKPRFGALIGRLDEVQRLRSAVDQGDPVIVVSGGPGIGKSHLVCDVLADKSDVIWVSSMGLSSGQALRESLADQLGVTLDTACESSRLALLRACVGRTVSTVVLDQVEQLADEVAQWAMALASAPSLQLIVTTQVPIPLHRLVPIRLAPLDDLSLRALLAHGLDFPLEDTPDVQELVRLLEGLPLAAVLVLPRLRALPPSAICSALRQNPLMPGVEAHDLHATHRSLARAISWSWSLLDEESQTTARLLARFSHAARYAEVVDLVGEGAASTLQQLVERGLLQTSRRSGALRYHLGSPVRAFGLHQALTAGDVEALTKWTRGVVQRARQAQYTAGWNHEHRELRQRWPTLQGLGELLPRVDQARLAVVLDPVLRGWAPAALQDLLDADYGGLPDDTDLELSICRIDAARRSRRREAALEGLAAAESRHKTPSARGRLATLRAFQALADNDPQAAIAHGEAAVRDLGGTGYHELVGQAALALGLWYAGDAVAARDSMVRLVRSLKTDEAGAPVAGTDFLNALVAVTLDAGGPIEAALQAARGAAESAGDWFSQATLSFNTSRWHLENGRFQDGRDALGEAVRRYSDLGLPAPDGKALLLGALLDLCDDRPQGVLQALATHPERVRSTREYRIWTAVLTELSLRRLGQHDRVAAARAERDAVLKEGPVARTEALLLAHDLVVSDAPVSADAAADLERSCTGRALLRWLLPLFDRHPPDPEGPR